MDNTLFTVEEENLLCIFNTDSRNALISEVTAAIVDFEEPELREIAQSALRKLDGMTDAEYADYVFSPAYFDEESEV